MSDAPSPRDIELWSPSKWEHVAGNRDFKRKLQEFAENGPSNLLVTGPWRSGKTRTINLGIKSILCDSRSANLDPCGTCPACRSVDSPLDSHTGLFTALVGSKYPFVQVDCENVSADTLKSLHKHIQWDDERLLVYLDEVGALGRRGLDTLLLKPIDEWPCIWFASAKSVASKSWLGKTRSKTEGLHEPVRARFANKLGTAVPGEVELSAWIKRRAQEWQVSIENEAETIPLLMKRTSHLIGLIKQPFVVVASRGDSLRTRILTLKDVQSFRFDAMD